MKVKAKIFARKNSLKEQCAKLKVLIEWSLLRHKIVLPIFTITQIFLSFSIVYGLALLLPRIDRVSAIYLSSGATTLGIIAVGCVLAAQIVSTAKQEGVVQYQKSLPVSRVSILLADFVVWEIASFPGIIASFLASYLRFGMKIQFSIVGFFLIILSQLSMISIGFAVAYWLSSNTVSLVSQVIMIGGLLFSPITYPAERLAGWSQYLYGVFPFVPISNLIRTAFYQHEAVQKFDVLIVIIWTVSLFILSLMALIRRE